jgi:hypothetical protein
LLLAEPVGTTPAAPPGFTGPSINSATAGPAWNRLFQSLDGVAEFLFGHSRPAEHAQPRRFAVEILLGWLMPLAGPRRYVLAVGSAPERLAHVDDEPSELPCKAARMAVQYLFNVVEATRHAPSLPPNPQFDGRRLPSKEL